MGTISLEHSDRLYWLGRYTERVFSTLEALGALYDRLIDSAEGYQDYLQAFGLADTYGDKTAFFAAFCMTWRIQILLPTVWNGRMTTVLFCVRKSRPWRSPSCKWRRIFLKNRLRAAIPSCRSCRCGMCCTASGAASWTMCLMRRSGI
ncbi:MAG: alpha-E domain-containing protein [Oscillospiraceae bacterium]|nr:alpha-E domain-containing protein [Oscillospiraceae bacterium]